MWHTCDAYNASCTFWMISSMLSAECPSAIMYTERPEDP